jgi:hypothetical protein
VSFGRHPGRRARICDPFRVRNLFRCDPVVYAALRPMEGSCLVSTLKGVPESGTLSGSEIFHLGSGGLRCASTTGYYLTAFQAESGCKHPPAMLRPSPYPLPKGEESLRTLSLSSSRGRGIAGVVLTSLNRCPCDSERESSRDIHPLTLPITPLT